ARRTRAGGHGTRIHPGEDAPRLRERWPRPRIRRVGDTSPGTGPVIAYQRWRLMELVWAARQNGRILPDARPFRRPIWAFVAGESASCPILLRPTAARVLRVASLPQEHRWRVCCS